MEILKYLVSDVNMDVRIWGRLELPEVYVGCGWVLFWLFRRSSITWELYRKVILLRRRNHSRILSSTEPLSKAESPVG